MDIRCRKTLCKFNEHYTCKAKGILVKKSCECEQYEKNPSKTVLDKTKKIFTDDPPKYAPQRDSKTIDIGCKAHCLFNQDGKCVANGITLNDIKEKPLCVTFLRE